MPRHFFGYVELNTQGNYSEATISAEYPVRFQTEPTGSGTKTVIFLKLMLMVRLQTAPTGYGKNRDYHKCPEVLLTAFW